MHNKIDIFLFLWRRLCPLNSAWSRTHFYVMFFSLGDRREGQTVLSEMIWQEEMFSSFKKYWRLLIVELIKLLLSRSQSASAMIHPSICLILAMNPGCLVYLLVRNIQRNIWSSHLFSLSVGETLFMAGILCKDSSCCRCWQIWLSHTCQDAKQSQGTARTRLRVYERRRGRSEVILSRLSNTTCWWKKKLQSNKNHIWHFEKCLLRIRGDRGGKSVRKQWLINIFRVINRLQQGFPNDVSVAGYLICLIWFVQYIFTSWGALVAEGLNHRPRHPPFAPALSTLHSCRPSTSKTPPTTSALQPFWDIWSDKPK